MQISDLVEERIHSTAERAENAFTAFLGRPDGQESSSEDTVRAIYQQFIKPGVKHWSNFTRETSLLHHVMIGPSAIVDLAPVAPEVFEKTIGVTLKQAEQLAESGAIIPNLYVRDPGKWAQNPNIAENYRRLLEASIVNGAITDTYFQTLSTHRTTRSYAHHTSDGTDTIRDALSSFTLDELRSLLPKLHLPYPPDDQSRSELVSAIAAAFGKNWAYLSVLATDDVAKELRDLLRSRSNSNVERALQEIRLAKHKYASSITAALGGHYFWPHWTGYSGQDLLLKRPDEKWREQREMLQEEKDILDFVYARIAHAHQRLSVVPERAAASWLARTDFRERIQEIWSVRESIGSLLESGDLRTSTFEDLDRLYEEIAREIETHQSAVKAAAAGSTFALVVAAAVTVLPFPALSAYLAGGVAVTGGIGTYPEEIGKMSFAMLKRDRSQFYTRIEHIAPSR